MPHRLEQSPNERTGQPTDAHRRLRLVVGSTEGDVAVVNARTGDIPWQWRTRRERGTLTQDGDHFYLALGSRHAQRMQQRLQAHRRAPTRLEARRLVDGALVWVMADWTLAGFLHVAVDQGTLLAASGMPPQAWRGAASIYALDTATGAVRWTVAGSECCGLMDRLVAARGGRVYVHPAGSPQRMLVLDVLNGRELWSAAWTSSWVCSPRGTLVAKPPGYMHEGNLILMQAQDGAEVRRVPVRGSLRLLAEDGVAYTTSTDFRQPWVAAVDAAGGGGQRWRADGVSADQLAVDETGDAGQLYFARLLKPEMVAEVGALDARTGEHVWSWRTPGSATELLRLWGDRTPAMLADAGRRCVAALATAFAADLVHPAPHWRRVALRRELSNGQWRRPYALHSANNAVWLEARNGLVFVGTRLGLFALEASDGHLRWHALPTTDLSFIEPALPPA